MSVSVAALPDASSACVARNLLQRNRRKQLQYAAGRVDVDWRVCQEDNGDDQDDFDDSP